MLKPLNYQHDKNISEKHIFAQFGPLHKPKVFYFSPNMSSILSYILKYFFTKAFNIKYDIQQKILCIKKI